MLFRVTTGAYRPAVCFALAGLAVLIVSFSGAARSGPWDGHDACDVSREGVRLAGEGIRDRERSGRPDGCYALQATRAEGPLPTRWRAGVLPAGPRPVARTEPGTGQPAASSAGADVGRTRLGRLAAGLAPGEFTLLGTSPGRLLAGFRPDGSNAPPIDTWTDSAYWDPQRQRIFFQGLRISNRFISYSAQDDEWQELSLDSPQAPPPFQRYGHLYSRAALDWRRGHFYRVDGSKLHQYWIDEGKWRDYEHAGIGGHVIEWHGGLNMLVNLNEHELRGFRDGQFSSLGSSAVHGYHSTAKYNPVREDMLLIGGNHSQNKVDILTADATVRHMADAPFRFGISRDNLTHDPISGNYLVLHRDRTLWEFDPDRDEWRVARDWGDSDFPLNRYDRHVPIPIQELGIIAWQVPEGLMLYRHESVFEPGQRRAAGTLDRPMPGALRQASLKQAREERPVAGGDGEALLTSEAATLEPGEWRNIAHLTTWPGKGDGVSFKDFQYVTSIDGSDGGADGMGWTQDLVYHEGKLMLLLMRDRFQRALMVMEPDGEWWRRNQPEGFDRGGRRPFNRLTSDGEYLYFFPRHPSRPEMGYMIRTPLDNPGKFERYGIGFGDDQIDTVGSFAATYVAEWDRFFAFTSGGKIWSWSHGERLWFYHGRTPVDEAGARASGYAGVIVYNPVKDELIVMGGQSFGDSPTAGHKVVRLTAPRGDIEPLPDMKKPDGSKLVYTSAQNKLIVDPRDGSYLQLDRKGIMYRNDSAGGTWSVYEDLRDSKPFGRYELYAPYAHIPGTDVIVFVSHIRGVVLHRLQPVRSGRDRAVAGFGPASEDRMAAKGLHEPRSAVHPAEPWTGGRAFAGASK